MSHAINYPECAHSDNVDLNLEKNILTNMEYRTASQIYLTGNSLELFLTNA